MNVPTSVGRGRRRARLALLSLSTVLCSGIAAPALAQLAAPAPVRQSIDANGVDLFSGRLNISEPGISMGQGEQALAYARMDMGSGSTDNVSASLNLSGSTMTVALGGTTDSFTVSGGIYSPTEGNGATLTYDSGSGIYTYTRSDGTVVHFSKAKSTPAPYYASEGRAIDLVHPSGTKLVYGYDTLQYCSRSKPTANAGPICLAHSSAYRLGAVTSSYGYQLAFGYAEIAEFDPNDAESQPDFNTWSTPTGVTESNTQNPGATSTVSFGNNQAAGTYSVTDPLSRTTSYRYGLDGIAGVTRPGSANEDVTIGYAGGRVASIATPAGTWNYAASDDADGVRTVTVTDPTSRPTSYTFDIVSKLMGSMTDALGHVTRWVYTPDGTGHVRLITAPEGNSVEYGYDPRGNVTSTVRHAKGGAIPDITTSAVYPDQASCGNAITYNLPTSTTDANGNTTDYTYDGTHGGVLSVTGAAPTPGGVRPQVRYGYSALTDALGGTVYRQTSSSSCRTQAACANTADEVVSSTSYGSVAANNLLPVSTSTGAGDGSLTATTSMSYDASGNMVAVDGPLPGTGDTTRYLFDAARRPIERVSVDPDGGGPRPNQASVTSFTSHDLVASVQVGTANPDGSGFTALQQSAAEYDAADRKLSDRVIAGGTTYGLTQYGYDAAGRPVCVAVRMNPAVFGSPPTDACAAGPQGSDGPDRVSQASYDALGRVTTTVNAYGTPAASTETTSYTVNGQQEYVTDANGNKTRFSYDGFDRLSQMNLPDPATPGLVSGSDYLAYLYDANGNLTTRRTRAGQLFTYGYDALNRLSVKTAPAGGGVRNVYYAYDLLGQITAARFDSASGSDAVLASYDALGRPVTSTTTMGGNSRPLSYQYDVAGRRTRITHPDGVYFDTGYDTLGNMLNASWWAPATGTRPFLAITYDAQGRRTDIARASSNTGYAWDTVGRLGGTNQRFAGNAGNVAQGYGYNPAGQVKQQTIDNDDYAYTANANASRSYAANGLNQYTSVGGTALAYDANGNLTSDGSATYAYDAENRLVSSSRNATTLTYDPLGRLWQSASTAFGKTQFVYDGSEVAVEYDGDTGGIRRRYMFGPGVDEPILWDEGGAMNCSGTRFLHTDRQGSVVAIADCNGNRTAVNSYDEYGAPASGNQGRFGYTGQAWLPDLGLWYYKNRMYSPALGRFMQTDPIGYGDGLNWHNYVGGDPVNLSDPSGTSCTGSITGANCGRDGGLITIYPNGFDLNNGTGDRGRPSGEGTGNPLDATEFAKQYGHFDYPYHDTTSQVGNEIRITEGHKIFYPNLGLAFTIGGSTLDFGTAQLKVGAALTRAERVSEILEKGELPIALGYSIVSNVAIGASQVSHHQASLGQAAGAGFLRGAASVSVSILGGAAGQFLGEALLVGAVGTLAAPIIGGVLIGGTAVAAYEYFGGSKRVERFVNKTFGIKD